MYLPIRRRDSGEAMTPTEFTPLSALAGGALIGLSAAMLMAVSGRIAGISGIVGRLLPPYTDGATAERMAFVLGLLVAPLAWTAAGLGPIAMDLQVSTPMMAVAGLIVGFGATWGSGCTSGHGVCGLARLSPRSLVAVLTFMATAAATVYVVRHVIGAAA
jgi:uncharacterized membrane protein YedE/YeeE